MQKHVGTPINDRCRIVAPEEHVIIEKQGNLLTVKFLNLPKPKIPPAKRKPVTSFSPAARMRAMKFCASINWDKCPQGLFVTLTYPDDLADTTMDQRNQQRWHFLRSMEKIVGKTIYGVWRIEWKPRRSGKRKGQVLPHWHFLFMNVGYIPYQKINLCWKNEVGAEGFVATNVRKIDSGKMATLYVLKYMSKTSQRILLDDPSYLTMKGRHYGYFHKGLIPRHPVRIFKGLTERHLCFIMARAMQRLPWLNPNAVQNFSLLGNLADEVYDYLCGIGLTELEVTE